MYKRKTTDEWEVQGYYGPSYGWERLTTETSYNDAKRTRKEYIENDVNLHGIRIIKKRVPIEKP